MLQELTKGATDAYDKILTRYPVMDRVDDAKLRLQALHQPIPRPTKEAVAQNQAEENSRHTTSTFGHLKEGFEKHPDVARATTVGDPTMVDPQMVSASDVVQEATDAMRGVSAVGNNTLSVETVGVGGSPPNQQAPRSDAATTQAPDPNELKPNVPASDPNELKPNVSDDSAQAPPPLQQINEIQPGTAAASAQPGDPKSADPAASSSSHEDDSTVASSKHKKKKGLKKVIPF